MYTKTILLGLICLASSGCLFVLDSSNSDGITNPPVKQGDYAPGLILVCLADGAKPGEVAAALRGTVVGVRRGLARIKLPAGASVEKAAAEAATKPGVIFAEPVYIYRSDAVKTATVQSLELPNGRWNTAESGIDTIAIRGMVEGEKLRALGRLRAAIIDTGIQTAHPDLAARVVGGYNAINNVEEGFGDDAGSGTLAAGIIGAEGRDDGGLIGMAPGVQLLAIKALNSQGYGYSDDIAAGIWWAADPEKGDVDLINLGLEGNGNSHALQEAIDYAMARGIVVIAAMGKNSSSDEIHYPAACSGVIAVGAARPGGARAESSGCGAHISVIAPGVDVPSVFGSNGFANYSGTSAAAAHVTGLAALLLAKAPNATPAQIRTVIEDTATRPERTEWDARSGYGWINARKAVEVFSGLYPAKYCALTVRVSRGGGLVTGATVVVKRVSDGRILAAGRAVDGEAFFAYLRVENPGECHMEAQSGELKASALVRVQPGGSFIGEIAFSP